MNTFILIDGTGVRQEIPFLMVDGKPHVSQYISAAEFGEHDDQGAWVQDIQIIAFKPILDIHAAVREQIGPWPVNSGYRSDAKQAKLYAADLAANGGKPSGKVARMTPHRTGAAIDGAIPAGHTAAELAGLVVKASEKLGYGAARVGWVEYSGEWLHFDVVYRLYRPNTKEPNPDPVDWAPGVKW
jgi:hypothetical protein